jgi:sugar phosphate permease
MSEDTPRPQINSAKLRVGGGIAGAIFTIGSMLIFLIGIPAIRYVFPAAVLVGCGVALLLRFIRHETPGASWLLSATEKAPEAPSEEKREHERSPGRSVRMLLARPTQDQLLATFTKNCFIRSFDPF